MQPTQQQLENLEKLGLLYSDIEGYAYFKYNGNPNFFGYKFDIRNERIDNIVDLFKTCIHQAYNRGFNKGKDETTEKLSKLYSEFKSLLSL